MTPHSYGTHGVPFNGARAVKFSIVLFFLLWAHALVHAEFRRTDGLSIVGPATAINGAWGAVPFLKATPGHLPKANFAGYLPWLAPAVLAGRGNYLYIFDQGRRQIYRYDLAQKTATPFFAYARGMVAGMAVAADLSLFVADAGARQVLHISADGRVLQTLTNEFDLGRPVAVSLDERTGRVWVADAMFNQIVLFNSLGRLVSTLNSEDLRSTESMAWGPDGAYIVDKINRQIVVLGPDGTTRYTLGQGSLQRPTLIAVDRFNRVFVIDSFDDSIKIFEQGELAEVVGQSGEITRTFSGISSLCIEFNTLYIADRMNARIVSFDLRSPRARNLPHD